MKIKNILLAFFCSVLVLPLAAQDVEHDDMYFTASDRAKLKAKRNGERMVALSREKEEEQLEQDYINPTDSYSARDINPEYTSRLNAAEAQADNEDYFINNYRVAKQADFNNWNNNYNNWYNSQWYGSSYFGPNVNSWNNPYYGGYYDSWGNSWNNPYYRSGWSTSMSFGYGNSWGYGYNNGWGMGYGYPMNNYWHNSWYTPAYAGWYSPWRSYGYYPGQIVIVEGNSRGPVYGKRPSRGRNYATSTDTRPRNNNVDRTAYGQNGRVAQKQEPYYNRTYSNSTTNTNTNSSFRPVQQNSRSNTQYNRTWSNGNNNNNNNSSSWSAPSRSTPSGGSPVRSGSVRGRGRD